MSIKRKNNLGVIRLRNAVFYAYHGVLLDEQNLGGKFEVDVDLHCDLSREQRAITLKILSTTSVYMIVFARWYWRRSTYCLNPLQVLLAKVF